jgi:hypothetical protein
MRTNLQLDTECAKVLLFLAKPENRDNYLALSEIGKILGFSNKQMEHVYDVLWHHPIKYVMGKVGTLRDPMFALTEKGKASVDEFEDIIHKERVARFPSLCNKVIRYITSSRKLYNTKELSEELGIDYEVVEAIADKFSDMGLVDLSISSGHDNLHVLNKAHRFVQESFFETDGSYRTVSIGNYIHAPNNKGIIAQDSNLSDNEMNQSNQ